MHYCVALKIRTVCCRACYGVLRFIMESGAKGCEVIVSGKLRAQRAKAMKFKDGYMIASGHPAVEYIDGCVRHVMLRQGVLGIKASCGLLCLEALSQIQPFCQSSTDIFWQSVPYGCKLFLNSVTLQAEIAVFAGLACSWHACCSSNCYCKFSYWVRLSCNCHCCAMYCQLAGALVISSM